MISLSPHPPGKSYGFTFVDDTDLSTVANSAPVYEWLAENGFLGTKTVWPLRATRTSANRRSLEKTAAAEGGSTLQDPAYVAFILKLKRQGFEIALHGNAAGNSLRDEIAGGLEHFTSVIGAPPALNAFHQTNIENLYCGRAKLDSRLFKLVEKLTDHSEYQGHVPGAPSFWGDLALRTFRYVRLPFHSIDDINTLRINPSMPFSDRTRPYVHRWFAASDGSDVLRFNRLLSPAAVQRLARQRGVCIIYTHFAKRFARQAAGGYQLDADFVKTVTRVASDSRAWFAPASTVLDRLSAVRAMHLEHKGSTLRIKNTGDVAIDNMVAEVAPRMTISDRSGRALNQTADSAVLPRIEPDESVEFQTSLAGSQTSLPASAEIPRRERLALEYLNYGGLVRGAIRDRLYYAGRRWRLRS